MHDERNVGETDRQVRYGLGTVALFLGVVLATTTGFSFLGVVLALVGLWSVATAATAYCPVSAVLGIDTCRTG